MVELARTPHCTMVGEVDMEIEGEPPAPDDVQARLRNLAENRGPPPERGKSSFLNLLLLTFTKKSVKLPHLKNSHTSSYMP